MMTFTLAACSSNSGSVAQHSKRETASKNSAAVVKKSGIKKILIVYFSRVGNTKFGNDVDALASASIRIENKKLTGNTQVIANMINKSVGGDVFEITTVKNYPVNYKDTVDFAKQEQESNARPKLSTHVKGMENYDVVFLGYPNWWGTIPMPVYTFLEEYDFSGKSIVPFATHEGSGLGSSVKDIKKLCPDSNVLDGLEVRGSNVTKAQSDVENWLKKNGMTE
ncbi:flavodoxin [Clostridium estertheticum]|nr:flavodoxin [Clostridium estertheticum]